MQSGSFVTAIKNLNKKDFDLVGRKSLYFKHAHDLDINLHPAFTVKTIAFDELISGNNLSQSFFDILSNINLFDTQSAKMASGQIADLISNSKVDKKIEDEILGAYTTMGKPYVDILHSHIIDDKFLYNNNFILNSVKGEENLIDAIKYSWIKFFSTEELEERVNSYYSGPLTLALIVKQSSKAEISGKIYSIPPITKDKDLIEITAIYGEMDSKEIKEEFYDLYKYDISDKGLKEKYISPQEHMIIKSGRKGSKSSQQKVPISKAWQRRQKVEDYKIEKLGFLTTKLEEKIKIPLEINWSTEVGNLFINNINHLVLSEDSTKLNKSLSEYIKSISTEKDDDLDLKIKDIVKKGGLNTRLRDVGFVSKEAGKKTLNQEKISIDFNIATNILLDTSKVQVPSLEIFDRFDGVYFDGTEMLIDNKILPETAFDKKRRLNKLISSYSLQISTLARNARNSFFIYKLSDISKNDVESLKVYDYDLNHFGDERFLNNPRTLEVELTALNEAINDYKIPNIHLCFPAVRNLHNLESLLDLAKDAGFKKNENKIYFEVSIPSIIYELNKIKNLDVDGVIINYDNLLRLMVYRNQINEHDHSSAISTIEHILELINIENHEVYVHIDDVPSSVLEKLGRLNLSGIIFSQVPSVDVLNAVK